MFDDLFKNLQDVVASKVQEAAKDIEHYSAFLKLKNPLFLFTDSQLTIPL